jgi:hypothetical protein
MHATIHKAADVQQDLMFEAQVTNFRKGDDLSCLGVLGKVPKSLFFTVCHALTANALLYLASAFETAPNATVLASVSQEK